MWVWGLSAPDATRPSYSALCAPCQYHGSLVALLNLQMAPKLILWISSGSKKKEPRYVCLSEANASHSQRMWAEVSSASPHFLHSGLSISPNMCRCLLRVLCPVRRPITALEWILLKDIDLALASRLGPEISSREHLWIPQGQAIWPNVG